MSTKTIQDAMGDMVTYGESAIRMILESEYKSLVSANAELVEAIKRVTYAFVDDEHLAEQTHSIEALEFVLAKHGGKNVE